MIVCRYIQDWRLHPFYNDILVSDSGIVLSYKRGFWYELHQSDNGSGYLRVGVGHENPQYVHILVAETYIFNPEPNIFVEVNHKNGHKYDNYVDNLEWVTTSENNLHAYRIGLKKSNGRPVKILETGKTYSSIAECARQINGIQRNISGCLSGSRKKHRGFSFVYADGDDNE
jgi:hypothetical protein